MFRARDTRLDRVVAIKVLSNGADDDPVYRDRFEREARAISALEHPSICALYDVGEANGRAYLVMQYLEGSTLATRLESGPLPVSQALKIAVEITSALDAAHRHGLVHRDVKPGNIMLTSTGAKLLDFGLAKQRPAVSFNTSGATAASAPIPLTAEGMILGTLHYMAPEQLCGEEADARSDIYAFGTVLFEMFAGKPPFTASDPASLIGAILNKTPPPLDGSPGAPPRIERAIRVCLEKEPADRWQSARDLLRELQWIIDERSGSGVAPAVTGTAADGRRFSRRVFIAGVAGMAVITAMASWAIFGRSNAPPVPKVPVVVFMDSPHPLRVYDQKTREAGGTNADDLSDLFADLPLRTLKENSGTKWHREDQLLGENPDLIIVHRSTFYDQTLLGDTLLDAKYFEQLYGPASDKLETLLAYIALGNARTRFIVYSRGSWKTEEAKREWVAAQERRFPAMAGRISAYKVPLDRATFRNPQTGAEIRAIALEVLRKAGRLPPSGS